MDELGDVLYDLAAGRETVTLEQLYEATVSDDTADTGLLAPLFYEDGYGELTGDDPDLTDAGAAYDADDVSITVDEDALDTVIDEYEARIRAGHDPDDQALRDRLYDHVRSDPDDSETADLARQHMNARSGTEGALAGLAGASLEFQSIANKPLGEYVDLETVDPALDVIGRGAMLLGAAFIGRTALGYSIRERQRVRGELDDRRINTLVDEYGDHSITVQDA